ncbi:Por secretion system C-terminal sorting domain-containing protein [Chryseobacterium sp. RU37D]|uniref:DUF3472 domain-containing protein n=1 Tax=Chryseobacterium sp. RU37D TaxID=1907397 RepID=UPI000956A3B2|nr:DUF3472 domain-containing protein [Chryseobacterium sp. RU37D]SIQ54442.1 Por secretion system C-terminal sorting domain-containing protein [Chryseobacterium sp. RU37D]
MRNFLLFIITFCFYHNYFSNDLKNDYRKHTKKTLAQTYTIPLSGNAFVTNNSLGAVITQNNGLMSWTDVNSIISIYLKVSDVGQLNIKVKAKNQSNSNISVVVNGTILNMPILASGNYTEFNAGTINIVAPGYIKIDLKGLSKSGSTFGDISDLIISGMAVDSVPPIYCNDPNYYYWARRGPSCHLRYAIPTSEDILYYYNEITVPVGEDKVGSYFMANGFADEGYFGIQVNSETERRVLFSVWSPYTSDNPNQIPEDQKIILNCKGANVYSGEFGNEGSGGQSYLVYNWKPGITYKFLTKGEPDGNGKTNYTAWFYDPEVQSWIFIASWKRPYTNHYLTKFYSFVENFNDMNGYFSRKVEFGNQWVRTKFGQWLPISTATFTADATFTANQRIDASGGVINNHFYLKNGGFTNETTNPYSVFTITPNSASPQINFDSLPGCTNALSVQEIKAADVNIYPNPADKFIKIKGVKDESKYYILDEDGRVVIEGRTKNELGIDISSLMTGVYFIKLDINYSHPIKFIKK